MNCVEWHRRYYLIRFAATVIEKESAANPEGRGAFYLKGIRELLC